MTGIDKAAFLKRVSDHLSSHISQLHPQFYLNNNEAFPVMSVAEARVLAEALKGWSPIETAPKDGTRILVYFGCKGVREVAWTEPECADWKIWCVDDDKHGPYALRGYNDTGPNAPTHWRPLPAPPAENPVHASDCALHNGPATTPKPCNCGADPGMTPERYGSEFPTPPAPATNTSQSAVEIAREAGVQASRPLREALQRRRERYPSLAKHPDDIAVDSFAAVMSDKLASKRALGYGGWDDRTQCSAEHLSNLLREHVEKGDPVDVANFAMMLHQRGERILPAALLRAAVEGWTLADLHRANAARQEEWCPDQKPDLSFRGNELAGEIGEACNVIKKLERERLGWAGSRDTVEHLAEELADGIMCIDLAANAAGISGEDLMSAVVKKFNAVSEARGFKTMLLPAPPAEEDPTHDD